MHGGLNPDDRHGSTSGVSCLTTLLDTVVRHTPLFPISLAVLAEAGLLVSPTQVQVRRVEAGLEEAGPAPICLPPAPGSDRGNLCVNVDH